MVLIININRLLDQTTKQPLSNFEPENLENISNFEGCGLTLVANKKISVLLEMNHPRVNQKELAH